jgi:hypothetical protein
MIHVERMWHSIAFYRQLMQEFVAATPKSVKVAAGLTREGKVQGEYGGYCPINGSVLRKMYRTYRGIQGTDLHMVKGGGFERFEIGTD